MNKHSVRYLTRAAVIAGIYVVLTLVSNAFGLASGVIQLRLSEALSILPVFCASAVPGLTVGCLLGNLFCGSALWDIVFGTLATLLGAWGTRLLRCCRLHWVAALPPVLSNMLIIPMVLKTVYAFDGAWWYFILTVGVGELLSCVVFGSLLRRFLEPHRELLFSDRTDE